MNASRLRTSLAALLLAALPVVCTVPARASACGTVMPSADVERELGPLGRETLDAIARGDGVALATRVHPSRGIALGLLGGISHHLAAGDVAAALRDDAARAWDGRSNMSDAPLSMSMRQFFSHMRRGRYERAPLVGFGRVVQEDTLCSGTCVAEAIATAFPCAPFIQYAYPAGSPGNPGMWRFVVVAFQRQGTGWRVLGLFEDQWSP